MARLWILIADLVPPEPVEAPESADSFPYLLLSALALVAFVGLALVRRRRQGS